jgi:hypothetical protein
MMMMIILNDNDVGGAAGGLTLTPTLTLVTADTESEASGHAKPIEI